MRKALIVPGLLLCWAFSGSWAMSASASLKPDNSKEIVLIGTVTKIYQVAGLLKRRAVEVRIDRVASGEFSGSAFTFAIHSPARAGLRVGGIYTISARLSEAGYKVDEFRLKEVRSQAKPSGKH